MQETKRAKILLILNKYRVLDWQDALATYHMKKENSSFVRSTIWGKSKDDDPKSSNRTFLELYIS